MHWCIRRARARAAHEGHRDSRVDWQGRATSTASPVSRSMTRRSRGRMQTRSLTAYSWTASSGTSDGLIEIPHHPARRAWT